MLLRVNFIINLDYSLAGKKKLIQGLNHNHLNKPLPSRITRYKVLTMTILISPY